MYTALEAVSELLACPHIGDVASLMRTLRQRPALFEALQLTVLAGAPAYFVSVGSGQQVPVCEATVFAFEQYFEENASSCL